MSTEPARYLELAEAAWRWVQGQVRDDDGPWFPSSVDVDGVERAQPAPGRYRDGMHEGIGGLAYVLAEVRLGRAWTPQERALVAAVAERLRAQVPRTDDATFFDGLSSTVGALLAVGEPGAESAVARLLDLRTDDGWRPVDPPQAQHYRSGARFSDATLGTAGVLLTAVWAHRHDVPGARELAQAAADVLLAEAEETDRAADAGSGLDWAFVPTRFELYPRPRMPNWSHGLAGIAGALAVAGLELDRPDLVGAARRGAEHLVTLADPSDGGCLVPLSIPPAAPEVVEPISYGWCHGPIGTSRLFLALDRAGVPEVGGAPTLSWADRGLHSVRQSGLPDRVYPGFWDNDGRCCGTAGVGDAFLDAYTRDRDPADLAFAVRLGDALVERAVTTGDRAYWRFLEHRRPEPLLPPGVGWMQGAAGIAAYLVRLARVLGDGADAPAVARTENWWALGRTLPPAPLAGAGPAPVWKDPVTPKTTAPHATGGRL